MVSFFALTASSFLVETFLEATFLLGFLLDFFTGCSSFIFKASIPAKVLPSISFNEAPPPVDTCEILDDKLNFSTADTTSPPPIIEKHLVFLARACTTNFVPKENSSIS